MPFTFSHPAIVLPLTRLPRKWYSLTGLMIGSMAPDFEYFLRMRDKSIYSHTAPGLLYFDLPVGLALCFVFHLLVRDSLIANLPPWFRRRFASSVGFDWQGYFRRAWPVVLVSLFVGAWSHLFWDSFTHAHGYFVVRIPSLRHFFRLWDHPLMYRCLRSIPGFGHFYIRYYNLVQHASSVAGLAVVAWAISRLPADDPGQPAHMAYWGWVALLTALFFTVRCLAGLGTGIAGDIVMSAIASLLWGLTLAPFFYSSGPDVK